MDDYDVVALHPVQDTDLLRKITPLSKVPALDLCEGRVLVNSPIICRFVDEMAVNNHGRESCLFSDSSNALEVNRIEALADGVSDCGFLLVMESLRPKNQQSSTWQERWVLGINQTLDFLDREMKTQHGTSNFHLGQIALLCAIEYINFRLPTLECLKSRPSLALWHQSICNNPSVLSTAPKA